MDRAYFNFSISSNCEYKYYNQLIDYDLRSTIMCTLQQQQGTATQHRYTHEGAQGEFGRNILIFLMEQLFSLPSSLTVYPVQSLIRSSMNGEKYSFKHYTLHLSFHQLLHLYVKVGCLQNDFFNAGYTSRVCIYMVCCLPSTPNSCKSVRKTYNAK